MPMTINQITEGMGRIRDTHTLSREEREILAKAANRLQTLAAIFQRIEMPDDIRASGEDGINWAFTKELSQ